MSGAPSFSWTLPPGPPLTQAQRELVTRAAPTARALVRQLTGRNPFSRAYADELHGVALEGFVWASQRYDSSRGPWLAYAYHGTRMRCLAWLRALRLRTHRERDLVLAEEDDGDFTVLDVTPCPAPRPDELCLQRQVLELAERLPERERIAVRRRLSGEYLAVVAREHGVAHETVRKWELSALERLRAAVGEASGPGKWRSMPPPDAARHLLELLADGPPRTQAELAKLTGYSRQAVGLRLRAAGASQAGVTASGAVRWTLPRKAA